MANYSISKKELKENIMAVLSEAIGPDGMSGDYMDDMQHLANTTGETMDDKFLDSVAQYDARNGQEQAPYYADRKKEDMDYDWRDNDDAAKDSQARYGKNAQELDRLNAFTDTVDQYLNDTNWNTEDYGGYYDRLGKEWDRADAERQMNAESILRKAIRDAIKESYIDSYNHPEQSNGNQFAGNHSILAHIYTHDGADAEWARIDQDKMHKKEQNYMKNNTKRAMDAADKRPLHRKGSLNRAFDENKVNEDSELDYDMEELKKAMQKSNGTYSAKSSDGQFQTGDKVIVHGRNQNIQGVISDFDINIMTHEENCDVDYDKNGDGKMWTMIGVPLSAIEKIS